MEMASPPQLEHGREGPEVDFEVKNGHVSCVRVFRGNDVAKAEMKLADAPLHDGSPKLTCGGEPAMGTEGREPSAGEVEKEEKEQEPWPKDPKAWRDKPGGCPREGRSKACGVRRNS